MRVIRFAVLLVSVLAAAGTTVVAEDLRTQTFPTFVAFCDVRDADVHEAADSLAILRRREVEGRLVVGRPAADIDDDPGVLELDDARRAVLAVHDDFPAEDPRVEVQRLLYVRRNEKVRHGEARAGKNFIGGIWHFSPCKSRAFAHHRDRSER
jgi:hypothetical protein